MNKIKVEAGQVWFNRQTCTRYEITSFGEKFGRPCAFSDNDLMIPFVFTDGDNTVDSCYGLHPDVWVLKNDPDKCQQDCCKTK